MSSATPNRLLAMLNATASPSPSSSPSTTAQNPTSVAQPQPPSGQLSPREPTPAPPGPSFQSISLQDLFKSIAPAPGGPVPAPGLNGTTVPAPAPQRSGSAASSVTATGAPSARSPQPTEGKEDQQNRLLGMLSKIGAPAPAPAQPIAQTVNAQANGSASATTSEAEAHRKVTELLAGLKSASSATAQQASQLAIPEPKQPESAPIVERQAEPVDPAISQIKREANGDHSTNTGIPNPSAPTPPPPARSPFHFVSPFDAFSPPPKPAPALPMVMTVPHGVKRPGSALDKSKAGIPAVSLDFPPPSAPPAVQKKASNPAPAVQEEKAEVADVKPSKEELAAVDAKVSAPVTATTAPTAAAAVAPAPASTLLKNGNAKSSSSRAASPASSAQSGHKRTASAKNAVSSTAPASVISEKSVPRARGGQASQGKKGMGLDLVNKDTTVDVHTQDPHAFLGPKTGAVNIIPTTMLKHAPIRRSQAGRVVGLTRGWMVYALSAGRLRLIDRDTGSRLVLQLPEAAQTGTVLDLAVAPTYIAALGADQSVTVFRVPTSWSQDDPPCDQVLHIAGEDADGALGTISQVEWVDRGEESLLAIGGSEGVVLLDPRKERGNVAMEEIVRRNTIMESEGPSAAFCFNATQQALAIISHSNYLTIYSVATRKRAFHKELPRSSSPTGSAQTSDYPSSIQFCETNLLIGRQNNTILDVVQITLSISVLGTLHLTSSTGTPLGFCQAVYDTTRSVLWVTAPEARGTLYGFQYALKGRPPVNTAEGESVIPFTKMVDVPLDAVLSLAQAREAEEAQEIIYVHPKGISMAVVGEGIMDALAAPPTEDGEVEVNQEKEASILAEEKNEPELASSKEANVEEAQPRPSIPAQPQPAPIVEHKETPKQTISTPKQAAPTPRAVEKQTAPVASATAEEESDDEPVIVEKTSPKALAEETNKQMKKMEDRIVTQFRQALSGQIGGINSRIDSMGGDKLATDITVRVEKELKGMMTTLIRDEVKKSITPVITTTVQSQLTSSLPTLVSTSIKDSLKTVPADLERILVPVVQASISKIVQQTVDRAVQDSIKRVVVPAVTTATGKMFEGLAVELRSEMTQMRKDLAPASTDAQNQSLRDMVEAMAELRRQVSTLSEQVRAAPPAPPALASPPAPPAAAIPAPAPPHAPPMPDPRQLEDAFLAALASPHVSATINLLNAHYNITDYLLPINPSPSHPPPLSSAVMLTLYHRLALALAELPTNDITFVRAMQWERRVASLIDPRVPEMASYYPRVVAVVSNVLGGVIQRVGNEPSGLGRALMEILDVVAQKG